LVVNALNRACTLIDAVTYRPFIVKLTERLPRWWGCQLAHLSMRLDDRWGTGYWASDDAPAAPEGLCDACRRRPAWLVIGGVEHEAGEASYLERHPVQLCGWCRLEISSPPQSEQELNRILADARARSVSWRWR
jgi:hypothetical protein